MCVASTITTMRLSLRRTLVLQRFYSAIFAVVGPKAWFVDTNQGEFIRLL
jgi:hypothetical protein